MKTRITNLFTFLIAFVLLGITATDITASSKDGKKGSSIEQPASYFLQKTQDTGSSEAKVFRTDIGTSGLTFENPYNPGHNMTTWGGTFYGTVDGVDAYFYCIDISHGIAFYTNQHPHKYVDSDTTSAGITYVLNNYYPFKSYPYAGAASTVDIEAAAVQMVMWHYADGVKLSTMNAGAVKTRALEIKADADANAAYFDPLETLLLVPASQTVPVGTDGSFFVSTFDLYGASLGGIPVELSTTSGTLSETSIVTTASGAYGPITIEQGSQNSATITAVADVIVPQGTKFVHKYSPDVYQKLVLATPAGVQRRVTAEVTWYQQSNNGCNTNGYLTYTKGGWGSKSNSEPGQVRDQFFDDVFPSGLVVGKAGGYTLTLTSAQAVEDFLPSGGGSSALTQNWTDPTGALANNLADQTVALTLNVKYDEAGKTGTNPTNLGDLVIFGGTFDGMSVYDLLDLANSALAGESVAYNLSDITAAATAVNENFDEGTHDEGYLTCQPEVCESFLGDYVWHDTDLDGKQDNNEAGIPGVLVNLIYDGQVVATSTTDNDGKYGFEDLANGNYTVEIDASNFSTNGPLHNYYATKQNYASDDKDSDGDLTTHRAEASIDCNDDLSVDFGFFLVCLEFEKTGPDTVKPGDEVTYNFSVHNCGDVTLGGGVTVYDSLINPVGNHQIWYKTVQPGESYTFEDSYTATEDDCGLLINKATAIGHPANVGWSKAQTITVNDSWTTYVDCNVECVGQIGDRVWLDYSNEGGKNNCNGLQDANESGIENVKVFLKDSQGNKIDSVLTDSQGMYLFTGLCDDTYKVQVDVTTLPQGVTPAPTNGGNNALDSNDNPYTVTLSEGNRINLTIDFGYCVEEEHEADLRIKKEASDDNPENGDEITYTITVWNDGPSTAENVVVYDVLPSGVIFGSSTASQGSYDENTGVWTVGTINSGSNATLGITVTVDVEEANTSYFDLGPAAGYNVFLWQDIDQPSADTEGKMAVGRNATLGNYSVGDKLTQQTPPEDVLIVGNNLTYTSGAIYKGNVVYGNSTNLPVDAVSFVDGTLRQDNVIDFNAAKSYLQSLSSQLAGYTANGTVEEPYTSGIFLTGTDPFLNVFDVDGTVLSTKSDIQIEVPNGAVVLVNVSGTDVSMSGGLVVTGTDVGNVLYNFYEAEDLSIQYINVRGSILAPWAVVNFPSGYQSGQLMAKSMVGSGQFNNNLFVGNIPTTTQITNCAEVGFSQSSGVTDPNEDNNNDCVTITVGYEPTSGGSSGSGSTGGTWEPAASFGITEIVYSIANDINGNMIAGTWGGKIYRNVNGEWTLINEGMNVAFIWSIKVTDFGYIYVATEKGVYLNTGDDVWTLVGLSDYDVRDIIFDSHGYLYAGTWGGGVFKSIDNGTTWTEMNDGLVNLAINSLAVNSDDVLFAATFGTGIARFEGTSWTQLANSYAVVWTVAVSADDILYAGTYGDGLQYSTDLGETWTKAGSSLPAMYIYSLIFDASNNLYVSSWTAGIYVAASSGSGSASFQSVGLSGAGVSSVFIDPANSTLYAGTKDGQIYAYNANATGVENTNELPTEYALEQNYPNPFNPTTNIKFSIVDAGRYMLKVYNILGQEVATLVNGELNPGNQVVTFDASRLASGIYIYQLSGNNINLVKKMMLMK